MFFVISGYTIFYQFFKSNYNLKYFIIQRVMRLSVPYWPLLVLLFIMGAIGVPLGANSWGHGAVGFDISWLNWLLHLTYMNFWSAEYSNTIIGVEWTLGIEFFYYVALGLIINFYLLNKLNLMRMLLLGCFFFLVTCVGQYLINGHKVDNYLDIQWSPMLYGYMFILGGIAYFGREKFNNIFNENVRNITSDAVGVSVFVMIWVSIVFNWSPVLVFNLVPYSPLLIALMTFLLVVFLQDTSVLGRIITCKPLLFIGSISYSMYLIHLLVLHTSFLTVGGLGDTFSFIYSLIIIILVSYVWYYVFEKRIYGAMKMKIRKFQ